MPRAQTPVAPTDAYVGTEGPDSHAPGYTKVRWMQHSAANYIAVAIRRADGTVVPLGYADLVCRHSGVTEDWQDIERVWWTKHRFQPGDQLNVSERWYTWGKWIWHEAYVLDVRQMGAYLPLVHR